MALVLAGTSAFFAVRLIPKLFADTQRQDDADKYRHTKD